MKNDPQGPTRREGFLPCKVTPTPAGAQRSIKQVILERLTQFISTAKNQQVAAFCLSAFLERHTRHSCNGYKRQFSLRGTGSFRGRKLTIEQLHLDQGVLPDNMVRSPSALHAKPLLKLGIPADVQMFHIILLSNALFRRHAPLTRPENVVASFFVRGRGTSLWTHTFPSKKAPSSMAMRGV